jgi:hypothetical protein
VYVILISPKQKKDVLLISCFCHITPTSTPLSTYKNSFNSDNGSAAESQAITCLLAATDVLSLRILWAEVQLCLLCVCVHTIIFCRVPSELSIVVNLTLHLFINRKSNKWHRWKVIVKVTETYIFDRTCMSSPQDQPGDRQIHLLCQGQSCSQWRTVVEQYITKFFIIFFTLLLFEFP